MANAVDIIDSQGHVDLESVKVSRHNHEELQWFAHGNESATITFTGPEGSPFQAGVFHVPAQGSVLSGLAKDDAKYNTPYKYTVVGPMGASDPEVIIVR